MVLPPTPKKKINFVSWTIIKSQLRLQEPQLDLKTKGWITTWLCSQRQILQQRVFLYIIGLLASQWLEAKMWQHLKQNTCDCKHSRYKALHPLNITSALFMI